MKRIVLAGGSGFLGRALARHFSDIGAEVVILTRSPKNESFSPREVRWDGQSLGRWTDELEDSEVVINLAGRSVDCRYHEKNRREIMSSRIESTRVIGQAIAASKRPPRVWLNASTATIYQHTFGEPWVETGKTGGTPEAKDLFSIEVARAWENEFLRAETPRTRKAALRTAMVLGRASNSVFPVLRRLVRIGLGGRMGDGRQFVSWIHELDFCRALQWLMDNDEISGTVNVCAPNPISNEEMMRTLREVLGVRFGLPATRWMLEMGAFFLRTETELVLKSRRVVPGRLLKGGFQFRFPAFREAVRDLNARAGA